MMKNILYILANSLMGLVLLVSCEDFVKIEPPKTDLTRAEVFTNDATAISSILGIYNQMNLTGVASGNKESITFLSSLSSDELNMFGNSPYTLEQQGFHDNDLLPTFASIQGQWSDLYNFIYKANAIIEGVSSSGNMSEAVKNQLEGEAKFIRAFSHFYLVNLFGDIPLVLTTDYRKNAETGRTSKSEIYNQIIRDLQEAKSLLSEDYSFSEGERVRPNKWVATALLARVYLYNEDWPNAESHATEVINNTSLYSLLDDLNTVFLKNSQEAIWQLWPIGPSENALEANAFYFYGQPGNVVFTTHMLHAFEPEDDRRTKWVTNTAVDTNTYYSPFKYKVIGETTPSQEYSMVLRLAEQYLIRAEARAHQGNLIGANSAASDVNIIRNRAGLGNTTATTQAEMLNAIMHERRVELFTEWGHRWLDLKRVGRADAVLRLIKPGWQSTDVLYPIPEVQLLNDPAMSNSQNPGY